MSELKVMMKKVFWTFMFFGALAQWPQVWAGLTVYPTRTEMTLAPGSKRQGVITVQNNEPKGSNIDVQVRDWVVLSENLSFKLSDWLTLQTSSFYLESEEKKTIAYTVNLPTSAVGVSAAMISFLPDADSGVRMKLSVSLYVTAEGTEKKAWNIESVKLVMKSTGNLEANISVINTGNVHVRPEGFLKLSKDGSELCRAVVSDTRPVYPGKDKEIVVSISNCFLEPGDYEATLMLNSGPGKVLDKSKKFKIQNNGEIETSE